MGFNWKEKAATSEGKQIVGSRAEQSGTISNKAESLLDVADNPVHHIIIINSNANYLLCFQCK